MIVGLKLSCSSAVLLSSRWYGQWCGDWPNLIIHSQVSCITAPAQWNRLNTSNPPLNRCSDIGELRGSQTAVERFPSLSDALILLTTHKLVVPLLPPTGNPEMQDLLRHCWAMLDDNTNTTRTTPWSDTQLVEGCTACTQLGLCPRSDVTA